MSAKLYPILMLVTSTLFSCKKDTVNPTRDEMLTGGSWKMNSMTTPLPPATGYGLMVVEYSSLPACRLDNTYRFEPGGRYVFDDGTISCGSTLQTGVGTWRWLNNQTQLETEMGGVAIVYDVTELSSSRIKLTETRPYMPNTYQWRVYTR